MAKRETDWGAIGLWLVIFVLICGPIVFYGIKDLIHESKQPCVTQEIK